MTLLLQAGTNLAGSTVFEEVPVLPIATKDQYELVSSPGLVLGVAAGDVIELAPSSKGEFRLVERGMNVCVQIFNDDNIDELVAASLERLRALGGVLDGKTVTQAVFTFPVAIGFPAIEEFLSAIKNEFKSCEWYYGNVYDSDGITPLNWWISGNSEG